MSCGEASAHGDHRRKEKEGGPITGAHAKGNHAFIGGAYSTPLLLRRCGANQKHHSGTIIIAHHTHAIIYPL